MRFFLILAPLLLFMQGGQQPVSIPIQNASFEQGMAGWQFGSSTGVMQSGGSNVAYAGYGGSFSQVLTESPQQIQAIPGRPGYYAEGYYALTFLAANYFPTYPGYYTAEITFGTQELCESSGWATQGFQQVTVICPGPAYIVIDKSLPGGGPVQGAQPLMVKFTVNDGSPNGGWSVMFDNVSLAWVGQ